MTQKAWHRRAILAIAAVGLINSIGSHARADNCDRPAIFWIVGDGDFDDASNFFHGCAPEDTDNVTFGASPYPTSGTVTFSSGANVNSLLFGNGVWTMQVDEDVTATTGIVSAGNLFLDATTAGAAVATGAEGSVSANTLVLENGVTLVTNSVSIATLLGDGSDQSPLKLVLGSGGTINSLSISGAEISAIGGNEVTGNPRITLGSGVINATTVSVNDGALYLDAVAGGDSLTIGASKITADTLYFGVGLGNTIVFDASANAQIEASSSYIYDTLTIQNGDGSESINLGNTTIGLGILNVSGSEIESAGVLVTGDGSADALAVHITDASQWRITGNLTMSGANMLIDEGSTVSVQGDLDMVLAVSPVGKPTAAMLTITGPDSEFILDGDATIGGAGIATLSVHDGAGLTVGGFTAIGSDPGSQGTMNVGGPGDDNTATVDLKQTTAVGDQGSGTLNVLANGVVHGADFIVGVDSGSSGTVFVSGLDALLLANALTIGEAGAGTVQVGAEGKISAFSIAMATDPGSSGTLTIANGGVVAVSNQVTLGNGGVINVSQGGALTVGTGISATPGSARIDTGGALRGGGIVDGNVVIAGGTVSLGDPVTLTINGNLTETAGVLDLEAEGTGPGQFDRLIVNGSIALTGGIVDIDFANGFAPKAGETFALMSASSGMSFASDLIQYTDAPAGLNFNPVFDSATDTFDLVVTGTGTGTGPGTGTSTGVPEPASGSLLLTALALMGVGSRSRRARRRAGLPG